RLGQLVPVRLLVGVGVGLPELPVVADMISGHRAHCFASRTWLPSVFSGGQKLGAHVVRGLKVLAVAGVATVSVLAVGGGVADAGIKGGPDFVDDFYETPFETPVTLDPLANDDIPPFVSVVDWEFVGEPEHGTIEGDVYTPDPGYTGPDQV